MTTLKINENEYKIKFGYNSFCDTDLMEKVKEIATLFSEEKVESDEDVSGMNKIKDLFCVIRELLFVGLKKHNPVDTIQDVGNLLDDYMEEETEEPRGLFQLFSILSQELMNEGFLKDIMKTVENAKITKIPQDHKKPAKE